MQVCCTYLRVQLHSAIVGDDENYSVEAQHYSAKSVRVRVYVMHVQFTWLSSQTIALASSADNGLHATVLVSMFEISTNLKRHVVLQCCQRILEMKLIFYSATNLTFFSSIGIIRVCSIDEKYS